MQSVNSAGSRNSIAMHLSSIFLYINYIHKDRWLHTKLALARDEHYISPYRKYPLRWTIYYGIPHQGTREHNRKQNLGNKPDYLVMRLQAIGAPLQVAPGRHPDTSNIRCWTSTRDGHDSAGHGSLTWTDRW